MSEAVKARRLWVRPDDVSGQFALPRGADRPSTTSTLQRQGYVAGYAIPGTRAEIKERVREALLDGPVDETTQDITTRILAALGLPEGDVDA